MQNNILELQPQWRYCRVRAGEKRPYPANWQNTPLRLAEVDSANIGLILGPASGGVAACDFDGVSAIDWFRQQFPTVELPQTPAWTSGRAGRVQMAFQVDQLLWPVLQTKKIKTGEGEGFEFRWTGAQSVLPPSVHPVTGEPYQWITTAAESVKPLPQEVIHYWVQQCRSLDREPDLEPETMPEDLTEQQVQEVDAVMQALKQRHAALNYDDWRTVCWGVAHSLGRAAAQIIMQQYYPERERGEYSNLFRTWNKSRSPTLGSVRFLAGLCDQPQTGNQAARQFLQQQNRFRKLF